MTDEQLEKDLKWIINECDKIQAKLQGSAGVFIPSEEDKHYYEELIERKIMAKDPLGEGYIFTDKYKAVYAHKDCNGVQKVLGSGDIASVNQTEEEKENDHRTALDKEEDS